MVNYFVFLLILRKKIGHLYIWCKQYLKNNYRRKPCRINWAFKKKFKRKRETNK